MIFYDRIDAGKRLSKLLLGYTNQLDTIVIALPRGGVVVGYEVAKILQLPLDIVCPRKIPSPFNSELAIGAITETGESVLFQEVINRINISEDYIQEVIDKEKEKAKWRLKYYRKNFLPRDLKEKTVIIVDDGLATGATMRAAIKTVRSESVEKIVLAIPVAPKETLSELAQEVDETVCLATPSPFYGVGQFYARFDQTSDTEVIRLLENKLKNICE